MKLKNLFVLAFAPVFAACQPSSPTASNVSNTQPSPTASVQTAPTVSNSGSANLSNAANAPSAPNANVKSNQPAFSPSPIVSPTAKAAASPTVSAAPKFKNYTANGIVKKIDLENSSIVIDHEDIGDYMVAMEMPFPVVNKDVMKSLKAGDKITFVLETGVGVERVVSITKK